MNKYIKISVISLFILTAVSLKCFASEVIYAKTEQKDVKVEPQKVESPEVELKNPFERKEKIFVAPQQEAHQEMNVDADEMEYISETNELEARGNVLVKSTQNEAYITADKAIFNRETNLLKFFDNVTLHKQDGKITGDYMLVDLNEENILMNEPVGTFATFKITAREGHAYANKIEAINGDLELVQRMEAKLASYGFGTLMDENVFDQKLANFEIRKKRSEPYRIETREILIRSEKDHDKITLKDANVYYKKFKLATANNVELYTDKNQSYVETNIPEFGSMSDFGTFLGWGYVQELPLGSTLKLVPSVVFYDGSAGIGGIARFRSKRNVIEAAWASSSENLIVKGKHKFNDDLHVEFSRHAYMDEWFNGGRRPGYSAQLVHHKAWDVPDLKSTYTQRFTAGYVSEYAKEDQEEQDGTMRLRWQSQFVRELMSIGDREQDMFMKVSAVSQVGATVYGKGDATGVLRVGPSVESRVKNWGSRVSFMMSGIHGLSPYRFDEYRYGKAAISLEESFRLCKYLAVGYAGTISPLKDNFEEDLLTENRFFVVAGPEDIKLALSHDTVREITSLDVMFLFGSDNFKSKYQKLIIENPNSLGKERSLFDDWKYRKIEVPEEL